MRLPLSAEWIAHRIRISAPQESASETEDFAGGLRLTEIGDRNDIHNTPDVIRRISLQFKAELSPRPASSTITAKHILGMYDFAVPGSGLAFADKIRFIVFLGKVASKESIRHFTAADLLSRSGLCLRQML